jgi:hypothetical protein
MSSTNTNANNTNSDTNTGHSISSVACIGMFNIFFISLMSAVFYAACSNKEFNVNENICMFILIGSFITVMTLLTIVGFGYATVGKLESDPTKKQNKINMAYNYEIVALLTMLITGVIGMLIAACFSGRYGSGTSLVGSVLIINALGECIGPCCSSVGSILSSL